MTPFHGKVALVTGANKGIGFETSRQLAALGFTVLMGARDAAKGAAAQEQLRKAGFDARCLSLDVTSEADRANAADSIGKQFGRLDVLVNNAGIFLDRAARPSEVSLDLLRRTFEANFFGAVELTRQLLPLLLKSNAARIVNLSSNLGSLTRHSDPTSDIYNVKPFAYDASKTALNAFTVHFAHELRNTPIKVNSAHPGWVKTSMGGDEAPMDVVEGAQTGVQLATLPPEGPTGGFFHLGETIPW
jgi:NAD(P)-dependent dehydrogenase (short-subunit alcohol dehydrogenase family)